VDKLRQRDVSVTLEKVLDNSKANSGGERDTNFLKYLIDSKLLIQGEAVLKRTSTAISEEYYLERYRKMSYESDRHFLCRTVIQDELKKMHINTISCVDIGDMNILRSSSNYDIATEDHTAIIDVGLSPARNFFRGLTDLKVRNYLITTYFDDYMDDIVFSTFSRSNDKDYINAVMEYEEGFKLYTPDPMRRAAERPYYGHPGNEAYE
jgi:hypothetical protein